MFAYVNLFCIKDPTAVIVISIVMCIVLAVMIYYAMNLFKASRKKMRLMTTPQAASPKDTTYCYLSSWNLILVQTSLILLII